MMATGKRGFTRGERCDTTFFVPSSAYCAGTLHATPNDAILASQDWNQEAWPNIAYVTEYVAVGVRGFIYVEWRE